jgi:hypothetical protein
MPPCQKRKPEAQMSAFNLPGDFCQERVAYYVDQARQGYGEEAFHGLRELSLECLDCLAQAYRTESDGDVRAVIIAAARERRDAVIFPVLREAVDDESLKVLDEVLEGLLTFATEQVIPPEEVIHVLCEARSRTADSKRREYLDEAIEQANLPPGSYGF